MTDELPWVPLYSTIRSGQLETTVYGLLYSTDSAFQQGDIHFKLWSRSLLKPWQLLVIYPTLKQAFPKLQAMHYALMMASQQSDLRQREASETLLKLGQLTERALQCPACSPMREANKVLVGPEQSPLNHPCSGKHIGHLLYAQALQSPIKDYLRTDFKPYQLLRELFSFLLQRDFSQEPETIDGCGMPNLALSAVELAQLYQWLVIGLPGGLYEKAPPHLKPMLADWDDIAAIMHTCPDYIGGQGRLDTRLIQGQWCTENHVAVVAKEGAEGLLTIALGISPTLPKGLGLLVKLASGYEPSQLDTIAFAVLKQLGLCKPLPRRSEPHVQIHYNFLKTPEPIH